MSTLPRATVARRSRLRTAILLRLSIALLFAAQPRARADELRSLFATSPQRIVYADGTRDGIEPTSFPRDPVPSLPLPGGEEPRANAPDVPAPPEGGTAPEPSRSAAPMPKVDDPNAVEVVPGPKFESYPPSSSAYDNVIGVPITRSRFTPGCDCCDGCCCSPLYCTPQMIGDFFGFTGSSISFSNQSTNRLGVFTRNFPQQDVFPSNNPLVVTQNNVNGNITLNPNINGGSFGTGVQVFPIATGGFTSAISATNVINLVGMNNNAIIPIVDATAYNNVASTAAGQQFGQGGLLVFVPSESGALATNVVADEVFRGGFDVLYVYDYALQMQVASPSTSGVAVGRQKIAENGSPLCRDRVFVDYGFLGDGQFFAGGVDVHRVVPGFEKCFGNFSVEMRFPFASTLDSDIMAGGITSTNEIEFGNITTYLKYVLAGGGRSDNYAISAGLGIALPTGDDVRVFDAIGTELVAIDNEAVHLLPFIGGVYTPNDRLFMQGFFQLDLDTNGNTVSVHDYAQGQLVHAGRAQDVNYAYFDASVGYWAYRNQDPCGLVQGIAPMGELHYNLPLDDTDVVTAANGFQVGNWADRAEALNGVLGMNVALRNKASVTAAYVTPLGGFDDQYDGAFRLTLNWMLGP